MCLNDDYSGVGLCLLSMEWYMLSELGMTIIEGTMILEKDVLRVISLATLNTCMTQLYIKKMIKRLHSEAKCL